MGKVGQKAIARRPSAIAALVALVAGIGAFVLVGAHVSALLGASVGAQVAAYAAALLGCLALPAALGAKVAGDEPKLPVIAGAIATFDVMWIALLVALAPAASWSAIAAHGDWFLAGRAPRALTVALRSLDAPASVAAQGDEVPDAGAAEAAPDAGVGFAARPSTDEASTDQTSTDQTSTDQASTDQASTDQASTDQASTDEAWAPRDVYARRADAVVTIHVRRPVDPDDPLADMYRRLGADTHEVSGSGFVIDPSGLVVTNHHVVRGAESARVTLRDGRSFDAVRVLATDPANDLELLAIEAQGLAATPLAPDEAVEIGASVYAIGSPLGLEHTFTQGIVSAMRDEGGTSILQTQAPIAPGSSGGPLFDDRGRVVGVNTATRSAGMHFSVHVRHVRALLAAERAPRALAPFAERVHVAEVALEGAPLVPSARANLEQVAVAVARVASGCVEAWPSDATPVVAVEVAGRGRREAALRSDQGDAVDRCLDREGDVVGFFAAVQLREAAREPATMTVRVEGLEATPTSPGHALVVRLARGS